MAYMNIVHTVTQQLFTHICYAQNLLTPPLHSLAHSHTHFKTLPRFRHYYLNFYYTYTNTLTLYAVDSKGL